MRQGKAEIIGMITGIIEEVTIDNVKSADIKPTDRLIQELGLDSLDYASVMLGCEQRMGIKISEGNVNWQEIQSVEQLAEFLESQQ